jgi:peptidase E
VSVAAQIIAIGGDDFALPLLRYLMQQARGRRVCFLGQASGENGDKLAQFEAAFASFDARTSSLSLFQPHTADIADFLGAQDVIYVGGGNTRSMLALWREWEIDRILREALEGGTVLAGISAGAICWFEYGTTDSVPGPLRPIRGLGFLSGSASPHYNSQLQRRPTFHRLIASNEIPPGIGLDDGAAAHFIDGKLHNAVSAYSWARVYQVERDADGQILERPLPTEWSA